MITKHHKKRKPYIADVLPFLFVFKKGLFAAQAKFRSTDVIIIINTP